MEESWQRLIRGYETIDIREIKGSLERHFEPSTARDSFERAIENGANRAAISHPREIYSKGLRIYRSAIINSALLSRFHATLTFRERESRASRRERVCVAVTNV